MEDLLLWAVVCFVIAIALLIAEAFIPSAGLISIASLAFAIAGVVLAWMHSTTAGLFSTIVVLILGPICFGILLMYAPKSAVGRRFKLESQAVRGAAVNAPTALVGHSGKALTDLRPVGTCEIDNQRVECLAQSGMIARGQRVTVVKVEGFEVVVRAAEER